MAVTVTALERGTFGNMVAFLGTIDFDTSYPTGGEPLSAAELGFQSIKFIIFEPTGGLVFKYDRTNGKVLAYAQGVLVGAAGSETLDDFPVTAGVGVTADTHISAKTGAGTVGLGALKEVPNTNNLSTITGVPFIAIGF